MRSALQWAPCSYVAQLTSGCNESRLRRASKTNSAVDLAIGNRSESGDFERLPCRQVKRDGAFSASDRKRLPLRASTQTPDHFLSARASAATASKSPGTAVRRICFRILGGASNSPPVRSSASHLAQRASALQTWGNVESLRYVSNLRRMNCLASLCTRFARPLTYGRVRCHPFRNPIDNEVAAP